MRKIGGANMNLITNLKGIIIKNKMKDKHSKAYISLEKSLKEVKLHREGKIHLDTWEEYMNKKQNIGTHSVYKI